MTTASVIRFSCCFQKTMILCLEVSTLMRGKCCYHKQDTLTCYGTIVKTHHMEQVGIDLQHVNLHGIFFNINFQINLFLYPLIYLLIPLIYYYLPIYPFIHLFIYYHLLSKLGNYNQYITL